MTEEVENLTIELLRKIREEIAGLHGDNPGIRSELAALREDNKGIHARLEQMDETMKAGFNGMSHWLELIAKSWIDDRLGPIQGRLTVLENRVFRRAKKPRRH